MNSRIKAALFAAAICLMVIACRVTTREIVIDKTNTTGDAMVREGARLFGLNCAHCHGVDATGDEGPDLHGVTKSDAKIASFIKNGIKGEMPKFGQKLSDADVKALIA